MNEFDDNDNSDVNYYAYKNLEEPVPKSRNTVDGKPVNYIVPKFCLVFLLNLPLPFFLGLGIIHDHLIEMFAGSFVLLVIGSVVCQQNRRIGKSIISGGLLLAPSQVLPIIQLLVGLFVLSVVSESFRNNNDELKFTLDGESTLIVSLLTGLILMILAYMLGETIRLLFAQCKRYNLFKKRKIEV